MWKTSIAFSRVVAVLYFFDGVSKRQMFMYFFWVFGFVLVALWGMFLVCWCNVGVKSQKKKHKNRLIICPSLALCCVAYQKTAAGSSIRSTGAKGPFDSAFLWLSAGAYPGMHRCKKTEIAWRMSRAYQCISWRAIKKLCIT